MVSYRDRHGGVGMRGSILAYKRMGDNWYDILGFVCFPCAFQYVLSDHGRGDIGGALQFLPGEEDRYNGYRSVGGEYASGIQLRFVTGSDIDLESWKAVDTDLPG